MQKVKLTSKVAGKSLVEIANLTNIEKLAQASLVEHRKIVNRNRNLEFSVDECSKVQLGKEVMIEIVPEGHYSTKKIQEIIVRRSGNKAIMFIRRDKEE